MEARSSVFKTKVVLKKEGETCNSTNECENALGCLWVIDKKGDQDMKCVDKYGCESGVGIMLKIRGRPFTSKMEHCLPSICYIVTFK